MGILDFLKRKAGAGRSTRFELAGGRYASHLIPWELMMDPRSMENLFELIQ